MRDKFLGLPSALQKPILQRIGFGVLCLILFLILAIRFQDLYLCISFLLIGLCLVVSGILLFLRILAGRFVLLEGTCQKIEKTFLRRHPKAVYFTTKTQTIKVLLRHRPKGLRVGDTIALYVADHTPVYRGDGLDLLNGYLTMTIQKGADTQ